MKKRSIVVIALVFIINILFLTNAKAVVLNQTEYEQLGIRRSYVIGKYVFDLSSHNPTLWDFLRATAFSDLDASMGDIQIIEIKVAENEDGEIERSYTSLETGEKLNSFPNLNIKYIYRSAIMPSNPSAEDKTVLADELATPTLTNVSGSFENNVLSANLSITAEGAYKDSTAGLSGLELYLKNGTQYELVGTYNFFNTNVTVSANETKTFVARVFSIDIDGTKTYSEYSNEVTIEYYIPATPTLKNVTIETFNQNETGTFIPILENGKYTYDLGINTENYNSNTKNTGYIIYEKNNDTYTEATRTTIGGAAVVYVEPGNTKTYVAKVYATDSLGNITYSGYSNEIVINHSSYATPTLNNVTVDTFNQNSTGTYIPTLENGKYPYDLGINSAAYVRENNTQVLSSITGYKVYEKNNETYTEVGSALIGGAVVVNVAPSEVKTYVARVYANNASGNPVYSDYSNEIVINHTNYAITYVLNGGSGENNNPDYYTYGVGLDHFNNPTRDGGYTFLGWYTNEELTNIITSISPTKTGNLILYAKWQLLGDINNDGLVNSDDKTLLTNYLKGVSGVEISDSGMTNSDLNDDGFLSGLDLIILEKYLLGSIPALPFATTEVYSITYELNGGNVGDKYFVRSYAEELLPYTLQVPVKEGYAFEGWTCGGGEPQVIYTIPENTTGNLTMTANWYQLTKPTIVTNPAGISLTGSAYEIFVDVFVKNETTGIVSYTKESGQGLELWTSDDGENYTLDQAVSYNVLKETERGSLFIEVLNDTTKRIKVRTYTIVDGEKVYSLYSDVVELVGPRTVILGDTNNDLTVDQLDLAYLESYLKGDFSEIDSLTSDLNNDSVVDDVDLSILIKYLGGTISDLPYYTDAKYTITYVLNGGTVDGHNATTYAEISLPYRLKNPEREGYVFKGWTGSNGDEPEETVTIASGTTGNLTYTANWIQLGDADENGEINIGDVTDILRHLSDPSVPINEAAADVNLDEVVDDVDVAILSKKLANVEGITLPYDSGNKYTITYNLNGGTEDERNIRTYAEVSLEYRLRNPERAGYIFTGWTGSNGSEPEKTVTIALGTTGNLTYTANWIERPATPTVSNEFGGTDGEFAVWSVNSNYNGDQEFWILDLESGAFTPATETITNVTVQQGANSNTIDVTTNHSIYVCARSILTVGSETYYSEFSNMSLLQISGSAVHMPAPEIYKYFAGDSSTSTATMWEVYTAYEGNIEYWVLDPQTATFTKSDKVGSRVEFTVDHTIYVTGRAKEIDGNEITYSPFSELLELNSSKLIIYGDVNDDGYVTNSDLLLLRSYLNFDIELTVSQKNRSDLDLDGYVDEKDYDILSFYLFEEYDSLPVVGNLYKVEFKNDSTIINTTWVLENHRCIVQPPDPVSQDLEFIGWYEEDSEMNFDFDTPITKNTFLIARFGFDSEAPNLTINPSDSDRVIVSIQSEALADNVEIYTSNNGTSYTFYDIYSYNSEIVINVSENTYFRARLVKTVGDDTYYTPFSDTVGFTYDNSREVTISQSFHDYYNGGLIFYIHLNDYDDVQSVVVYSSSSESLGYSVLKMVAIDDGANTPISVQVPYNSIKYCKVKVLWRDDDGGIISSTYSNSVKLNGNSA